MIKDSYTVLHDDNGAFVDKSFGARDFTKDSFGLDLVAAEDYLYIGLYKPFNVFYAEMLVANTAANTFAVEYFDKNDAAYKTLVTLDETMGLTRSGFISFDKPTDNAGNTIWDKSTVNGTELFWVRLKPSVDHDAGTSLMGLNVVFSNDFDLVEERGNIVSKHLPTGQVSWIAKHQAAKKDIIQDLRNRGNSKQGISPVNPTAAALLKNLTEFDILDAEEIRQASKYLTLAKIYFQELSDDPEDKYAMLGERFLQKAEGALDLFYLSIDKDDDGLSDPEEQLANTRIDLIWP